MFYKMAILKKTNDIYGSIYIIYGYLSMVKFDILKVLQTEDRAFLFDLF